MAEPNAFLARNDENGDFNQYWYSPATIQAMVAEVVAEAPGRVAFLSTPSVFFSMPEPWRARCSLLEYDEKWRSVPEFVKYDFHAPRALPAELEGRFSMVVIDPPFITRDVWEQYAESARFLLQPGGKILLSTIAENADMMRALLGVAPRAFRPSIPHLVYQYNFYTNYESALLAKPNPEIPE